MRIVFATADPFSQVNWLCSRLPASDPRPAPSRVELFAVPPQRWNIRPQVPSLWRPVAGS